MTEKYSENKSRNQDIYNSNSKPFLRRIKQSGLAGILALSLLGAGCEGGSGSGSSTTTLYEARTGNEVQVENSMLDNANEYSVSQYKDALRYTDIAGENKGQVLYDSQEAALAHGSSSSSSDSSSNNSGEDSGSSESGDDGEDESGWTPPGGGN